MVFEEGKVLGLHPFRLRALSPTSNKLKIEEIEMYPPLQKNLHPQIFFVVVFVYVRDHIVLNPDKKSQNINKTSKKVGWLIQWNT